MAKSSIMRARNLPIPIGQSREIAYLTDEQVNDLVEAFRAWYDEAPTDHARKTRGRYWLTFLVLRFTGARREGPKRRRLPGYGVTRKRCGAGPRRRSDCTKLLREQRFMRPRPRHVLCTT